MKKKNVQWTRKRFLQLGIPAVLIPGLLIAITLGWNPTKLSNVSEYYKVQALFPKKGVVREVYDGDTFRLQNGVEVRLIGIDAPNRGDEQYAEAKEYVTTLLTSKRVYLEYDRYQDDKYGRVLAWVWIGCEDEPTFLAPDYMRLRNNASRAGLLENPKGCTSGTLVNEVIADHGFASVERYKDRGELKYEKRLLR